MVVVELVKYETARQVGRSIKIIGQGRASPLFESKSG